VVVTKTPPESKKRAKTKNTNKQTTTQNKNTATKQAEPSVTIPVHELIIARGDSIVLSQLGIAEETNGRTKTSPGHTRR
jgi:hypothetical protein